MARTYDLVIVGPGTAAMVAAMRMRSAGRSVAVRMRCTVPGGVELDVKSDSQGTCTATTKKAAPV
jgi:pyruvate/2-oxoglutarate dehydrogenase complex dihydrolipoamide dehydrogenase (E3) component